MAILRKEDQKAAAGVPTNIAILARRGFLAQFAKERIDKIEFSTTKKSLSDAMASSPDFVVRTGKGGGIKVAEGAVIVSEGRTVRDVDLEAVKSAHAAGTLTDDVLFSLITGIDAESLQKILPEAVHERRSDEVSLSFRADAAFKADLVARADAVGLMDLVIDALGIGEPVELKRVSKKRKAA